MLRKTYIKISWKILVNRECLIDTNGRYYHDIILARSPDDPPRIGVASVFEPFAWLFLVCLPACQQIFSFFFSSPPLIVLSPLLLARSPEYPQRIRVASVFEPSAWLFFVLCSLSANFLIFLLLTSSFIVLSPLLLARSPEYPQRIRVASVFEPSVCLLDCSLLVWLCVCKFSNFSSPHPPLL